MKFFPEQLLQIDCVQFTRIMCPKVLLIASMNGLYLGNGKNAANYIAKMKMLGMVVGDLDIRLHWQEQTAAVNYGFEVGRTAYVELKSGKNEPTDDQNIMMAKLEAIGIPNGWTNSLEGYINLLRGFNVPMRKGIYGRVVIQ